MIIKLLLCTFDPNHKKTYFLRHHKPTYEKSVLTIALLYVTSSTVMINEYVYLTSYAYSLAANLGTILNTKV